MRELQSLFCPRFSNHLPILSYESQSSLNEQFKARKFVVWSGNSIFWFDFSRCPCKIYFFVFSPVPLLVQENILLQMPQVTNLILSRNMFAKFPEGDPSQLRNIKVSGSAQLKMCTYISHSSLKLGPLWLSFWAFEWDFSCVQVDVHALNNISITWFPHFHFLTYLKLNSLDIILLVDDLKIDAEILF